MFPVSSEPLSFPDRKWSEIFQTVYVIPEQILGFTSSLDVFLLIPATFVFRSAKRFSKSCLSPPTEVWHI